ncbi:MAG: cation diffusion facilitator family transporter [Bacteroidetes bacterium]|nr:cation diffusion facilitator family transporter [Bacteroidota bacterium]
MDVYRDNLSTRMKKYFDKSSAVFPSRISLIICSMLAAGGIFFGILENSLSVTANGLIAATEILTSLLFLSAIKQSIRAPDYVFNYGYGKYESMAILAGSTLLTLLLIYTIIEAVKDFGSPVPVKNYTILIIYSLASFMILRRTGAFLRKSSKKFQMPLLEYDAEIWKTDSLIEMGVLVNLALGAVVSYFHYKIFGKYIDSLTAVLLLSYSLKVQITHGRGAINQLLDHTLPENIQFDIISVIAENINRFCEFKKVHTRQSGKDIFIEIDVIMPWDFTLEEAYQLEKDIHNSLVKKYPTAIPRLYVTPCPGDCVHDGKTSCPVKLSNDANRKKIDNIQNIKQN